MDFNQPTEIKEDNSLQAALLNRFEAKRQTMALQARQ
jgi:hypothetical protein